MAKASGGSPMVNPAGNVLGACLKPRRGCEVWMGGQSGCSGTTFPGEVGHAHLVYVQADCDPYPDLHPWAPIDWQ